MKHRMELVIYVVILTLFSAVTLFTMFESRERVAADFFDNMSRGAEAIAAVLAQTTIITDKDMAELKSMPFVEAVSHPLNKRLIEHTKDLYDIYHIRYAYIMTPLKASEIRYHVDKSNTDFYGTEVGEPLNLMWLLDVLCDKEDLKKTDTPQEYEDYYKDINRYSYIRDGQQNILKNRRIASERTIDEWGGLITAYAPVYTVEGNFAGMLGIDISTDRYSSIWHKAFSILLAAYSLTFCLFLFLTLWIYRKFSIADRNAKYTDSLTGAYNRRYQEDHLTAILASQHYAKEKNIAFIMVDIDHFKTINDTYGHALGDISIRKLYTCLRDVIGQEKGVVVRWGGDEFMAIAGVADMEEAESILAGICARVKSSRAIDAVVMSVSVGCCVVPRTSLKISEVESYINRADAALYEAKDKGRDCFVSIAW